MLLRLPYLSNGVLNYALALTAVPARWLLLGSALGLAPGAALFALVGAEVRSLTAMLVAGEPPPAAADGDAAAALAPAAAAPEAADAAQLPPEWQALTPFAPAEAPLEAGIGRCPPLASQ